MLLDHLKFPQADLGAAKLVKEVPSMGEAHLRTPEATRLVIRRLSRRVLPVDTVELARYLLGKMLVRDVAEGRMSGRIVETEAYIIGDEAGHAFDGPTPRNRALYLERGHAYVYFIYGSCSMLNVTSELSGIGAGVLLRALEPLEGIELMKRGRDFTSTIRLTNGPGRLTSALRIDRRFDEVDLCGDNRLWLGALSRGRYNASIGESVRTGVTRASHRALRFYERGNPFVSGPKRLRS
jgi:DNA-3-methyladenine glycosylase